MAQETSYLNSLGLQRHPFPVAPDDEHFFVSEPIEQIVVEVVHAIEARKGFMVISGDVGLGKTTMTRRILHILEEKAIRTSFVFHTSLKNVGLLREINRDFGLPDEGRLALGEELQRLNAFLLAQYQQGHNCAIIIDDAQNLDRASLELVRMISNLETDTRKLVQILLVGQPELSQTLSLPDLRQLKSRIFIHKAVCPLNPEVLRTYVLFKLSLAGNQGRISMTDSAFAKLNRYAKGNFRQINMLMDRCLYALCRDNGRLIDHRTVQCAAADLLPNRYAQAWRRPAMAVGAALILLLTTVGVGLYVYTGRGATATVFSSQAKWDRVQHEATVASDDEHAGSVRTMPSPNSESKHQGVDPAILAFLKYNQLEAYATEFEQARLEDRLSAWGQRIFEKSGRQLVQLPAVSEAIRRQYGALALPDPSGESTTWLLFWRPKLTIERYFLGYKGEEIIALQQQLAAGRLYRQNLDGVVGPHLMKALISFQNQYDLPVTGYPDATTLFALYHRWEEHS